MPIDFAGDMAAIQAGGDVAALSVAYAQGANTKTIATAWRIPPTDRQPGEGLDEVGELLGVLASEFTSGFSASNPVTPSPGDAVTVGSEAAGRVARASLTGGGSYWELEIAKAVQRGTA